jgi:hypothetical protein
VETRSYSRDTASQADEGGRPSPPYPLTSGDTGFWLRRGEQLGRAGVWIAATIAAGYARVATWLRHVASKGPGHPPPQPG